MAKYIINDVGERVSISRAVLTGVAVAGFISVAVLAPNALQIFKHFKLPAEKKKLIKNVSLKYGVQSTIARLEQEGCIIFEKKDAILCAQLTEKGEKRLAAYETKSHNTKKREWDGKWRVVIFDVAEGRRPARDLLRRNLKSFGFLCLQKSVWVFPYDCEDFISIVKTDKKLWGDVLYMVADHIEGAERFKKIFKLRVQKT
ncbi:MAG: hypothetical protein A2719_04055 [Candidatus Ryanbacteria bacterium RIFCSPHIGHO2_01_FULL_45_22]|uniref:Transcriptional repressor PaaX-like central Cas2-like domain-containing protein n=1 Tax=Candidatus Ryanbacteria bacterium RIFCSPHIGHO2_01_FULL_45_22 TaxID=1802114 RepID=A0A1G2G3P4_9BACT|nr:MAG: hypothetical protein A2719_04055 [Candidatus Ryanbacteria bacterium RIFCSPHIGHO2_01_FULL_45_22]